MENYRRFEKLFFGTTNCQTQFLTLTLHKKKLNKYVIHTKCFKEEQHLTHTTGAPSLSPDKATVFPASFQINPEHMQKSTLNQITVTRGPNCILAITAAMFQHIWAGS